MLRGQLLSQVSAFHCNVCTGEILAWAGLVSLPIFLVRCHFCRCVACKDYIVDDITTFEDLQFHGSCFVCTHENCGVRLMPSGAHITEDGHMLCESHFLELVEPPIPCARCKLGIGEDDGVTALDRNWHAACFRCSEGACDVDIASEGRFYDIEHMPYCTKHYMLKMGKPCARYAPFSFYIY